MEAKHPLHQYQANVVRCSGRFQPNGHEAIDVDTIKGAGYAPSRVAEGHFRVTFDEVGDELVAADCGLMLPEDADFAIKLGPYDDSARTLDFFVTDVSGETYAELDLADEGAGALDTIVRAAYRGTAGNSITVELAGDSAAAEGVTIEEDGNDVLIHFEDGVSTVADVEAAITASATLIVVKTAGTGATVLAAATDEFAAANLAGGGTGTGGGAPADPEADDDTWITWWADFQLGTKASV